MVSKRSHRRVPPPPEPSPAPRCGLCGREVVPGPTADEHHLVPRSEGGTETSLVHKVCHHKIHATFDEKELARRLHTWEALRAEPEIAAFVAWLRNKPPTFTDRSRRSARRR